MIWGECTGVFNSTSSSGLTNDSIINSPEKSGVFTYFYDTKTFIASSVTSPFSHTLSLSLASISSFSLTRVISPDGIDTCCNVVGDEG